MQDHVNAGTAGEDADQTLARKLDLTAVPLDIFAWLAVLGIALAIRLIGRANWPLSPGESSIARDAFAFFQGGSPSSAADAHPVMVQLTAFLFFLFGDTDGVARLLPLIAGIGVIITLFWLRTWFGSLQAISIAIVWAISPVMVMSTLRLDGGAILILTSLIVLALTMTLPVDPDPGKAIALGVAIAIGLTAHPLGWVVIPLTLLPAMILVRNFQPGGRLLPVAISLLATLLIVTSWFGSRPSSVLSWFDQSFSTLWAEYLSESGSDWVVTILVLVVDEPLLLILGTIGGVAIASRVDWADNVHPAIFVSCLAWAIPLVTLGIILGGKGPDLYSIAVFPLVVVGGLGLAILLDGVRNTGWRRGITAIWIAVVAGLIIVSLQFAETLALGPEGDAVSWALSTGLLGLLFLLPLGYLTIRLAAGSGMILVPVSLLAVVFLVGVIEMRTALLLPSTSHDRPGEILQLGNTTRSAGLLVHRLTTYSRDATTHPQDVRDPEGGHGLMIAVEEPLDHPFAWYFREFPNLQIVESPNDLAQGVEPDAVIAPIASEETWNDALSQHEARAYPVRYQRSGDVDSATYRGLLLSAINPFEFGNIWEFIVYRSNPDLLEAEEANVYLREDHAGAVWGTFDEE